MKSSDGHLLEVKKTTGIFLRHSYREVDCDLPDVAARIRASHRDANLIPFPKLRD